jgi:N-acetyl-gamma-glutamyl-phosphate reductase
MYREFYKGKPFVFILQPGEYPATKNTWGSNFCHIGATVDKRTNRVVIMSVIDNLVKGAAGQAIQNMNIMYGLDEKTAFFTPGVCP